MQNAERFMERIFIVEGQIQRQKRKDKNCWAITHIDNTTLQKVKLFGETIKR